MSALIPDPDRPGTYLIGSATEDEWGIQVGATVLHNVHSPMACAGEPCVIHSPSPHRMREWDLVWRGDKGMFERTCPEHGVGHPDPDSLSFLERRGLDGYGVHGCCGCCR